MAIYRLVLVSAVGMARLCLVLLVHSSVIALSTIVSETTKAPPAVPENLKRRLIVREGAKTYTIACPAEGSYPLLVSWTKDNEQITPAWTRFRTVNRERDLRIKNVAVEDAGLYKCHAANGFGSVNIEFTLEVIGKDQMPYEYSDQSDADHDDDNYQPKELKGSTGRQPFWVKSDQISDLTKQPVLRTKGSTVRLKCLATGHPVPDISWTKDGDQLDTETMPNKWVLTLKNLKIEDAGRYTCKVLNMFGSLNATFAIGIIDDKPEFEKTLLNSTITVGQTATFQCKIRSHIPPTMKWIKRIDIEDHPEDNRTFFYEGRMFKVLDVKPAEPVAYPNHTYMKQLVIPEAKMGDAGWYFCVVADTVGNIVNRSAHLKVLPGVEPVVVYETLPLHITVGVPIALLLALVVGYAIYFLQKHQQKSVSGGMLCQRNDSSGGMGRPMPPNYPPPSVPNGHCQQNGQANIYNKEQLIGISPFRRSSPNNSLQPQHQQQHAQPHQALPYHTLQDDMAGNGSGMCLVKDVYKPYHRLDPMACVPLNSQCSSMVSSGTGGGGASTIDPYDAAAVYHCSGATSGGVALLDDDVMAPPPSDCCYDSGLGSGQQQQQRLQQQHYVAQQTMYACR